MSDVVKTLCKPGEATVYVTKLILVIIASLLAANPHGRLRASNIFWDGDFSDSWNDIGNWHFEGFIQPLPRVPADVDVAILSTPNGDEVRLHADSAAINGLQVSNNIDLITDGHLLNVDNGGAAETIVSGGGSFIMVRDLAEQGVTTFITDHLRIQNGGAVRLDLGANMRVRGTTVINNARLFETSGEGEGPVVFGGDVTVSNGGLLGNLEGATNNTDFTFAAGSAVTITSGATARLRFQSGRLDIDGEQAWHVDGGTLELNSDLRIDNASLRVTATGDFLLDANESITVRSGGEATFDGFLTIGGQQTYILQGGRISAHSIDVVDFGEFDFQSGVLSVGIYDHDLINKGGVLAPGTPTGNTSILGDYTQHPSAALQFDIGGLGMGAEYDFVNVAGHALLDGTLEVALVDDFVPSPDDEFLVLNADSLGGFFDNAGNGGRLETSDHAGSFLVNYGVGSAFNSNQIVLSDYRSVVTLDLDGNGVIDGADFLAWQRGESPNRLSMSDLAIWEANFGTTGGRTLSTKVSEPTSRILVCIALLVGLGAAFRR